MKVVLLLLSLAALAALVRSAPTPHAEVNPAVGHEKSALSANGEVVSASEDLESSATFKRRYNYYPRYAQNYYAANRNYYQPAYQPQYYWTYGDWDY